MRNPCNDLFPVYAKWSCSSLLAINVTYYMSMKVNAAIKKKQKNKKQKQNKNKNKKQKQKQKQKHNHIKFCQKGIFHGA